MTGAIYSQPKGISDDNAASLTQTYIRCNIPLRKIEGIDINDDFCHRLIWFRNLFIQLTYSTNVGNLNFVDSSKLASNLNNPDFKLINRLDLLQYAKFNLNFMSPILTLIVPKTKNMNDLCHIYLDPYFAFITTSIMDSPANNFNAISLIYGGNLTVKFNPVGRFLFEINARMFGINPLSGGINPNYNFQYARQTDYDTSGKGKPLTVGSRPYYNFDGLLIYNTNKANNDSSSNIFLHFSVFGNLPKSNYKEAKNSYFQLQIGYGADLEKLLANLYKTLVP